MSANKLEVLQTKLRHIPADEEGLRLWLRLVDCTRLVEEEIRQALRETFAMTLPRFEVMSAINRVPDGLTMSELSQWLMVTKGNVTGIAERLSEDGYIKRRPTPTDRRSFCVTLTAKGQRLVSRMQAEHERIVEQIFDGLGLEDNDMLMGILARIKDEVEQLRSGRIDS